MAVCATAAAVVVGEPAVVLGGRDVVETIGVDAAPTVVVETTAGGAFAVDGAVVVATVPPVRTGPRSGAVMLGPSSVAGAVRARLVDRKAASGLEPSTTNVSS